MQHCCVVDLANTKPDYQGIVDNRGFCITLHPRGCELCEIGEMGRTRMSKPPKVCLIQATKDVMEAGLEMSSWRNRTFFRPSACNSWVAFNPRPSSRAASTTVRPSCASCRTISSPMPLLPPVTTATVSSVHHLAHKPQSEKINPCMQIDVSNF
jgi:hypothetical protein